MSRDKKRKGMPRRPDQAPRPDYSGFGPYGPQFQSLHEKEWEAIEEMWERSRAGVIQGEGRFEGLRVRLPPMHQVLDKQFDRSGWFYERLMVRLAKAMDAMDDARAIPFWETLRSSFSPMLRSAEELAGDREGLLLRLTFVQQFLNPGHEKEPNHTQRAQLNNVCHGPFTKQEVAYMLRRYPRIAQVGCGSAYLAYNLLRRGCDIVAHDNNKWHLTNPGLFSWANDVFKHGRLIVTDDAQAFIREHADRALLITWPEGGSTFPSEVLEEYATAGGKSFLLKVGGFVGYGRVTPDPSYRPPENAPANVVRFFELLSKDWEELRDDKRPRWNPWAWGNNLLVFGRRS